MKKSFLNLRKLGLIVVAASTMAMYSCSEAEEHADEATEAVENAVDEMKCEEGKCEHGDATEEHTCGEGKCDDGAAAEGETKCDGGKCDGGTATE